MNYSMHLLWSEEDGGYVATVPELFDVRAFGETAEEAAKAASEASEAVLSILAEDGDSIPNPVFHTNFSGQLRLRLPKSMHRALSLRAQTEGVSLNTLLNSYLARGLGQGEACTTSLSPGPTFSLNTDDHEAPEHDNVVQIRCAGRG